MSRDLRANNRAHRRSELNDRCSQPFSVQGAQGREFRVGLACMTRRELGADYSLRQRQVKTKVGPKTISADRE